MTRIATVAPSACSACYGQYPDRVHVDFDAAWDGPVLDGSVKVTIDDLVVCEDCLRDAIALLPDTDRDLALERLRERITELEAQKSSAEDHAEKLERALASKLGRDKKAASAKVSRAPNVTAG